MSSHVIFREVGDADKARLEAYWARKLPRLQKRLAPYRDDLQEIALTVYRHPRNSHDAWYEVRAVIHLPTGTLAAEDNDPKAEAALDRVTDKLAREIKRHKELVRHDYLYKRKARSRADLRAAGAMLQRDAEGGRRDDFFRLLRPHLRFLRNYARRQVRLLEREGMLHRREANVADLVDEVLTRAWERFAERPRRLPLDLWLIDLLHEVLEQWVKEEPRPHVSLEAKAEEVLPAQAIPKEEPEWWAELLGEEETVTLEELVPDREVTESWDELGSDEQRDRLLSLLAELPAVQRQAFLLHALENYDTAEIAMLQDRPEGQVKADIEAARRTLRERLTAGGHVRAAGKPGADRKEG